MDCRLYSPLKTPLMLTLAFKDIMCERKQGEGTVAYSLRLLVHEPRVVLGGIGLVAACFLYWDLRTMFHAQAESYREITAELRDIREDLAELKHR